MTVSEIATLLDEKLAPINARLAALEADVKIIKSDVKEMLKYVPVGNSDLEEELNGKRRTMVKL